MKKTYTEEEKAAMKERFALRQAMPARTFPINWKSGKNKKQRNRIIGGFDAMWTSKSGGNRCRFLTK